MPHLIEYTSDAINKSKFRRDKESGKETLYVEAADYSSVLDFAGKVSGDRAEHETFLELQRLARDGALSLEGKVITACGGLLTGAGLLSNYS